MRQALLTVQRAYRAPFYRALLVEAHRRTGPVAEALRLAGNEFPDDADLWVEPWLAAEVVRLIGEALASAAPDHCPAAEARFKMALDFSQRQGAKSLELRAAMSLARFWRTQGRTAQARDLLNLLAPVFGWFTEGFDSPDLKNAKSLMDALT
jgi:predicted ATPase